MFSTTKNTGNDLSLVYEPTCLEEMLGNREQISQLSQWIEDEETEEKMALVYAPPGVGKTLLLKNIRRQFKDDNRNVVNATELTDEEIEKLF